MQLEFGEIAAEQKAVGDCAVPGLAETPPPQLVSLLINNPNGAVFSRDRKYRYLLWRTLDPRNPRGRAVNFIGLNPSRAGERENDQTIRRCMAFALAWDFALVLMTNIYAFCSTDPKKLLEVDDPIGKANDLWISAASRQSDLLVPCWGTNGGDRGRLVLGSFIERAFHLGLNKDGSPKHPSRLPGKLRPESFKAAQGTRQ